MTVQSRSCMHEAGAERFRPRCRRTLALARGAAFVLIAAALACMAMAVGGSPAHAQQAQLQPPDQPIITDQLGRSWYLKSSDATWTFNLRHHTSTEVPLSAGAGRVWKLADGLAINSSVSGEWMAYRQFDRQTEQFTLKFECTVLFPTLAL